MEDKKEQEDTTIICPNPKCGKRIYRGELCSCQQSKDDKYGQPINQSTKDYGKQG